MANVAKGLDAGALASLEWTLVRAGVNGAGAPVPPVASADWSPDCRNSLAPVSYEAMGRWMLEEARERKWVRMMPLVSKST